MADENPTTAKPVISTHGFIKEDGFNEYNMPVSVQLFPTERIERQFYDLEVVTRSKTTLLVLTLQQLDRLQFQVAEIVDGLADNIASQRLSHFHTSHDGEVWQVSVNATTRTVIIQVQNQWFTSNEICTVKEIQLIRKVLDQWKGGQR